MKTSRGLLIWATLALCGVMVLGAMSWLTHGVLASEKERAEAESRADLEERTRLALWRMDAFGATIILRENGYAPDQYFDESDEFQHAGPPEVLLHFEIRQDQKITSPEAAAFRQRVAITAEKFIVEARLKRLQNLLVSYPLPGGEWTLLNEAAALGEATWQAVPKGAAEEQLSNTDQRQKKSGEELRKDTTYQNNSNTSERAQRAKAMAQTTEAQNPGNLPAGDPSPSPKPEQVMRLTNSKAMASRRVAMVGQMRPVWLGGELFLLRQTTWSLFDWNGAPCGKEVSVQGAWMDVPAIRASLLRETADLLPDAKLVRVEGKQAASDPLSLVSFPFHLQRNESTSIASAALNGPLLIGWVAVLLALLTASLLVHGVMRLSERRASFVSAVTHELRTPLTTFRLYSDMLERGAVKPEKRGDYLRVLSHEADRLSHLVENVLSFSKIERGSARSVVRESTVADLLEPMRERLEARLTTAGMTLEMDTTCAQRVRVDTAAVEHILFNLIDNSAKYAAAGDPPKVRIQIKVTGRSVEIIVTDHGQGIPPAERRRIFRAFHKSAREAAESRPGVGLGLALSRRLAKSLGGGLECVDSKQGACFVLSLPVACN